MPAPTLNVVATPAQATAVSSIAVTLTAVPANDIINVVVGAEQSSTWSVSSVTATGLTFQRRAAVSLLTAGGSTQGIETWWAVAPGGGFTGSITATLSEVIDDATIHGYSVTGAATSDPFDGAAATTAKSFGAAAVQVAMSTTSSAALVVVAAGTLTTSTAFSGATPVGMASMSTQSNVGGALLEHTEVESDTIAAALSATAVGWTSSTDSWTLIADAFVAVAVPRPVTRHQLIRCQAVARAARG